MLYGDSYLPVDFGGVAAAFAACGRPALMTVFANEGKWDTSNVWFEGGAIKVYDKKNRLPEMRHIDYGLICLTPGALAGARRDGPCDLADVLRALAAAGLLAGLEVAQRFYEVGSVTGLRELEGVLLGESAEP